MPCPHPSLCLVRRFFRPGGNGCLVGSGAVSCLTEFLFLWLGFTRSRPPQHGTSILAERNLPDDDRATQPAQRSCLSRLALESSRSFPRGSRHRRCVGSDATAASFIRWNHVTVAALDLGLETQYAGEEADPSGRTWSDFSGDRFRWSICIILSIIYTRKCRIKTGHSWPNVSTRTFKHRGSNLLSCSSKSALLVGTDDEFRR